jgi:hypothetical protein
MEETQRTRRIILHIEGFSRVHALLHSREALVLCIQWMCDFLTRKEI